MKYRIKIGPVVLMTDKGAHEWINFCVGEDDGELYIQRELIDIQGNNVKWQRMIKLSDLESSDSVNLIFKSDEQFIHFNLYDQDKEELFVLTWDKAQMSLYISNKEHVPQRRRAKQREDSGDKVFIVDRFSQRSEISDASIKSVLLASIAHTKLKSEGSLTKSKKAVSGNSYKSRLQDNYWRYIGRYRSISTTATAIFLLELDQNIKPGIYRNHSGQPDFDYIFKKIVTFFWSELEKIKNITVSQEEYSKVLKYLKTSDVKFLDNVSSEALVAITNFYACYKHKLPLFWNELNLRTNALNINVLHVTFLHAIELESLKYRSARTLKKASSARLRTGETFSLMDSMRRLQLKNQTPYQGIVNIVEFRIEQLVQMLKRYRQGLDKFTLIMLCSSLSQLMDNDDVWYILPSPLKGYLYLTLRVANENLNLVPSPKSRLYRLSQHYLVKTNARSSIDYQWANEIRSALEILRIAANLKVLNPDDEDGNRKFIDDNKWFIRSFKDRSDEIVWSVIFNNPYLRDRFLGSVPRMRAKATMYPSIAAGLIMQPTLRKQYYEDHQLEHLYMLALLPDHYDTAVALYQNEKICLSAELPNNSDGRNLLRSEYLAIKHPKLAVQMIKDGFLFIRKDKINLIFDRIWEATSDHAHNEELQQLFDCLYENEHWSPKLESHFKAAKKLYRPTKGWGQRLRDAGLFGGKYRANSVNCKPVEDNGEMNPIHFNPMPKNGTDG